MFFHLRCAASLSREMCIQSENLWLKWVVIIVANWYCNNPVRIINVNCEKEKYRTEELIVNKNNLWYVLKCIPEGAVHSLRVYSSPSARCSTRCAIVLLCNLVTRVRVARLAIARKDKHIRITAMDANAIEASAEGLDIADDCASLSSFGSNDDSFKYAGDRPSCDELPAFSIQSVSPSGLSISPIGHEPSLLNLSISPISSESDLSDDDDDENDVAMRAIDRTATSSTDDDDSDHVSLDEINAQINTPPSATSQRCSTKRLNLETIFEGVFLETPPKKRKYDSWGIRSISKITVERINTYVMEQRQKNEMSNDPNRLCDMFDNNIDIS